MADKFLAEAEWKKFAKGRDLKDATLLKALVAFEKARDPAVQLEALATIEKEIDGLRKFVKGDRDFGAQLDGMEKAHGKEEKLAKAAAKESEGSEDEDEDSPALLTGKLIPLLRELKKGEAEFPALIAVGGKEAAVLISRRAISPARRKLLADYLAESGTPKFVIGHCVWEANSYTFVVQTQASGLAKKLRAAILKQTDLRAKVRVRGEDGAMDDDGEPAELEAGESQGQDEPGSGVDPFKADYDKRWAALEPEVMKLLKAGNGDVAKLRAVAEFVSGKAKAGAYEAAIQGIASLQKLIDAVGSIPAAPPMQQPPQVKPQTVDAEGEALAFKNRLAALMPRIKEAIVEGHQDVKLKASEAGVFAAKKDFARANALLDEAEALMGGEAGEGEGEERPPGKPAKVPTKPLMPIWEVASESAVDQTSLLFAALRKFGDPELNRMADDLLQTVNNLLADVDEALEEYEQMTGEERAANAGEARDFLRATLSDITSDPLIKAADSNTLNVKVSLRKTLERALDDIAAAFEA